MPTVDINCRDFGVNANVLLYVPFGSPFGSPIGAIEDQLSRLLETPVIVTVTNGLYFATPSTGARPLAIYGTKGYVLSYNDSIKTPRSFEGNASIILYFRPRATVGELKEQLRELLPWPVDILDREHLTIVPDSSGIRRNNGLYRAFIRHATGDTGDVGDSEIEKRMRGIGSGTGESGGKWQRFVYRRRRRSAYRRHRSLSRPRSRSRKTTTRRRGL